MSTKQLVQIEYRSKNFACVVAPILTVIFRKSYETGCIPDEWRSAYVTPAFKKGKNCDPSNYRSISLTCVASKLMGHIITSHGMHHANRFNMLYYLQHGFRDRRSCETQLLEFQASLHRQSLQLLEIHRLFGRRSVLSNSN